MSRRKDTFWHELGHGLVTALSFLPGGSTRASTSRSGRSKANFSRRALTPPSLTSHTVAGGVVASLIGSLVTKWSKSRRPSSVALAKGAIAGAGVAGAALLVRVLVSRPVRGGMHETEARPVSGEVIDELLAGAGRGLIYAALLAPNLPGPPLLRGALAGTADYLAAPLGGLFSRLQAFSPIRRVPVISILLETGDAEDEPYLAFLIQGMLMGLIYGRESDER